MSAELREQLHLLSRMQVAAAVYIVEWRSVEVHVCPLRGLSPASRTIPNAQDVLDLHRIPTQPRRRALLLSPSSKWAPGAQRGSKTSHGWPSRTWQNRDFMLHPPWRCTGPTVVSPLPPRKEFQSLVGPANWHLEPFPKAGGTGQAWENPHRAQGAPPTQS